MRPWDLVSDDGQQFLPASEHPELASLFVDSDFVAIAGYHCVNHRDGETAGNVLHLRAQLLPQVHELAHPSGAEALPRL